MDFLDFGSAIEQRWAAVVAVFLCGIMCMCALFSVMDFLRTYWWKPCRIRRLMQKQGVSGPPPRFMIGNISDRRVLRDQATQHDMGSINHDIVKRLMPDYLQWSKIYGKRFIFWWGVEPRLTVSEPELIREVLSCKYVQSYGKSDLQREGVNDFIGKGLVMANGDAWAHQRRVVAPAFHQEKLKGQVKHMVDCTTVMLASWDEILEQVEGPAEIEVNEYMSRLAGDIIARTEFGSSYENGKKIFSQLNALQKLSSQSGRKIWLPGNRLLLTSSNRQIRKLKKEVERSLLDIIQARRDCVSSGQSTSYGQDLLGLMLTEIDLAQKENKPLKFTTQQLMDECKTFFFTGHDTTSLLLTWTLMLLASNPAWQERARQEAFAVCKDSPPDAEVLSKLKVLGMILNESLRLYTPASLLARQAFSDMQLGDLFIPKGLSVWIPALAIHHDKGLWGEDANEFNPERFAEGGSRACKHPMGYLPFSMGSRNCVGQNFAIMEAKVVLAMILRRVHFRIAPSYRHAPVFVLTLKPKHGVQMMVERL